MSANIKHQAFIVEYLDHGRLKAGFVVREQERHLAIIDSAGRERMVARDLVLMRHSERRADRESASAALEALEQERVALAADLDLELLWNVVQEQGRSFSASELAELFFGQRSSAGASVMLEALLNDRIYFVRRHMDFVPRTTDQVERLRLQNDRIRARSDDYRKTQKQLRDIVSGAETPPALESAALIEQLSGYLRNPYTRSREITQMLEHAAPDVDPAEAAFEILERLDARPPVPRFAFIAGLKAEFPAAAEKEALEAGPSPRPLSDGGFAITIDDDDTVEVDDALSIDALPDGNTRLRIHIALLADLVKRGGAMDLEAASRATTVYLPEATIRMLPDAISCGTASLTAGEERPVLTTDVVLSGSGEVLDTSIYPARIRIMRRLNYDDVDRMLALPADADETARSLRLMHSTASLLRERRRTRGALLIQRREAKVRVRDGEIDVRVLDTGSPGRTLVGEMMVLSNFVAARFAANNRIPIIYRVQPQSGGDFTTQKPRLSLHPEYHAGIGLDFYAQLSSPIRRYADLVLQRQLLGALSESPSSVYTIDELLEVLALAENAEASGRELERRAKRYWILRYLERSGRDAPLPAYVTREGAGAELANFVVRGTLNGAPNLPNDSPIVVRVGRVDPLRGWLSLDYVGISEAEPSRSRATTGALPSG